MSLNRHLIRGRDLARLAGDHTADVLAPLALIGRGLRRHLARLQAWWHGTPADRRGPTLLLAAAALVAVALMPYGPLLALAALMASAAWAGRDRAAAEEPAPDLTQQKLQALYAALTP